MNKIVPLSLFLLSACTTARGPGSPAGPIVAAHQHLVSSRLAPFVGSDPIDAAALLRMMDAAGAHTGVILSMGYSLSDERKHVPDPEARTRDENDWTAAQVAVAPDRLIGFCSVNPLMPGALVEIDRCNRLPGMHGLKLHIGNSGVDLRNPTHLARMEDAFAAADRIRVPIVVHLRPRSGSNLTPDLARIFIDKLLPRAEHIPVQIAHLAGSGPGYSMEADAVLAVFADAIRAGDPRTRRLIFDATTVVAPNSTPADGALVAKRIRQLGIRRVFFGSDLPIGGNPPLQEAWALFRSKVPLTAAEFRQLARNVPTYLR